MNKGSVMTEKAKKQISKTLKGRFISPEAKANMRASWTPERRQQYRERCLGKHHTEETKAKMRATHSTPEAKANTCIARAKQAPLSNEARKRISEKSKAFWNTPEMKQFASIHCVRITFPKQNTDIERTTEMNIIELGKVYYPQYAVTDIAHPCKVDFYLPDDNLMIFCDGCYWHGCRQCHPGLKSEAIVRGNRTYAKVWEKDKIHTEKLQEKGYRVLRLWEHEIKNTMAEDLQKRISAIWV